MGNIKRVFTVDGQPYFIVGAQARNSSGYNDAESERAFRALKAIHGNTLEVPVYWGQVEPSEGHFDFTSVDALLTSARRYGVRLVLLWFGTWKNGDMDYVPDWVKTNPQRFRRVLSSTGKDIWNLSSYCRASFEADKAAFTAFCRHLKERDGDAHTVIALQVENESGILGCDRDYGPDGQTAFDSPVPADLVAKMRAASRGWVYEHWQKAGGREAGSWPELFGWEAGELMTAWSIAGYIDRLVEAGKAIYDLPMYINVWLGSDRCNAAGEAYPSGGAVAHVLDIYKWYTPHIDLIAPDIYIADTKGYEAACADYARDDNPLFVPESPQNGSNAWLMFSAVGNYDATGYSFFAAEDVLCDDGSVHPECRALVESFQSLAAAVPLLLKYQGSGRIHAVVQEEFLAGQWLDLEGYTGQVEFDGAGGGAFRDWRHSAPAARDRVGNEPRRGRGLVIQAGPHEFYLVGSAFRLTLRPKLPPEQGRDLAVAVGWLPARQAHYVSVDEGHFDERGAFVVDRQRNGDEFDFGLWVEADTGVVRAILCE